MASIFLLNGDGKIVTAVRSDLPLGWVPPEGLTAVAEADLPPGTEWVPTPPPAVPEFVELWQFHAAIGMAGLTATIAGAIDALDEPKRSLVKAQFERRPTIHRANPLIIEFGAGLGMTPVQIDQIFILAASQT